MQWSHSQPCGPGSADSKAAKRHPPPSARGSPKFVRLIGEFFTPVPQSSLPLLRLKQPKFSDVLPDIPCISTISLSMMLSEFENIVEGNCSEIKSNGFLIKCDHVSG